MREIVLESGTPMTGLMARAVARRRSGKPRLPDGIARTHADIDIAALADYNDVCGFSLSNTVPATYLHVVAFPLQVALMSDGEFPYPLVGSVHIENTITQYRPVTVGESLDFTAKAQNLRPHRRGVLVDFASEARVGDELVWSETSTYLFKGQKADGEPAASEPMEALEGFAAQWKLPASLGRSYAGVSGDVNPIHMSKLAAKALGFPTVIVHGMWSASRCLAALENRLPQAFTYTVRFAKPITLPGRVAFTVRPVAEGFDLTLTSPRSGKVHMDGTVRTNVA